MKALIGILIALMTIGYANVCGSQQRPSTTFTQIDTEELSEILRKHKTWLDSDGQSGQRAVLSQTNLSGMDLRHANLTNAILKNADLSGADLSEANLSGANLNGANLRGAKLHRAILKPLSLSKAALALEEAALISEEAGQYDKWSILQHNSVIRIDAPPKKGVKPTLLNKADLTKASMSTANFSGAMMQEANFSQVIGSYVVFAGADLHQAVLKDSKLSFSDLSNANLTYTNLAGADLLASDLTGAELMNADLRGANLQLTQLNNAAFNNANFTHTRFAGCKIGGAYFEPSPQTVGEMVDIAFADGLDNLRYGLNSQAIVTLYQDFKNKGYRKQGREVARAIKHTQVLEGWSSGIFERVESVLNYVFFELTCEFGLKPGRALLILVSLLPIFAIPYLIALKSKDPKVGIWIAFSGESLKKKDKPSMMAYKFSPRNRKRIGLIRVALYFSLQSATSIGYREINVWNWISRLQWREYALQANGWARTISGVQSLISVYLLAIWILTYFGTPFEP